jgi:hypothetical protein
VPQINLNLTTGVPFFAGAPLIMNQGTKG